jgi:hypothetical protein
VPTHELTTPTLEVVSPNGLSELSPVVLLDRWKKDLNFDYELEVGKILQRVSKAKRIPDLEKAELLIKAAAAVKALQKTESTIHVGKGAKSVKVMVVNPTQR